MAAWAAILDPDAEVESEFWSVTVRTTAGQTVHGIRLNEDTSSMQIRTDQGRLVSFVKADLRDYTILTVSPMPSFKDRLTETDLADVVAYLLSLKGR